MLIFRRVSQDSRLLGSATMSANKSFDTDTQRHCAASRAREHTSCGAMPLRAGQLRR
jgi:hypothetical protein